MHITGNVIEEIKKFEDCSYDLIFSDPPYNLGSNWIIDENGKPTVKGKAVDFMNNKWEGLTGEHLESMFNDFNRILKHGGYVVFAGQMRQAMAFQYYAIASGLEMIEPIYSYSISSLPKALDVSKSLDKYFGVEREVVGKYKFPDGSIRTNFENTTNPNPNDWDTNLGEKRLNITAPSSDLAKKYNGIKSSICPLKQTTEVWFIFRKSFKHGTIVKDILAYEDGDKTITISGLNIDAGRVPTEVTEERIVVTGKPKYRGNSFTESKTIQTTSRDGCIDGRYPAQLFLDGKISYTREEIDLDNTDFLEFIGIDVDAIHFMDIEKAIDYICNHLDKFDVSKLLDEQSGEQKSISSKRGDGIGIGFHGSDKEFDTVRGVDDSGGASKVLHNSGFTLEELYQHIYYSKASKYERNAMIGDIKESERFGEGNYSQSPTCFICKKTINGTNDHTECEKNKDYKIEYIRKESNDVQLNNHPTLKSLKLLYEILKLFKKPDHDNHRILIPFSGVFSEKIAMLAHGYKDENIDTIEISEEYSEIGKAREKFWTDNDFFFIHKGTKEYDVKKKESEKKKEIKQGKLF